MATVSECRYRWLRVQDLNLLTTLGGDGSRTHGGFWRTIKTHFPY
jgi:hypothetical protein